MIVITKPFRDIENIGKDGRAILISPSMKIKRSKKREKYLVDSGFAKYVDEPKKTVKPKEDKNGAPKKMETKKAK